MGVSGGYLVLTTTRSRFEEMKMKIKEMLSQNRRDFSAIFECEHCGATEKRTGYDDTFYHSYVIPDLRCPKCGLQASEDYEPRATKYADWEEV